MELTDKTKHYIATTCEWYGATFIVWVLIQLIHSTSATLLKHFTHNTIVRVIYGLSSVLYCCEDSIITVGALFGSIFLIATIINFHLKQKDSKH